MPETTRKPWYKKAFVDARNYLGTRKEHRFSRPLAAVLSIKISIPDLPKIEPVMLKLTDSRFLLVAMELHFQNFRVRCYQPEDHADCGRTLSDQFRSTNLTSHNLVI